MERRSAVKFFKDLLESKKVELKGKYNWMQDEHLLSFCPSCGAYEGEARFLKETGYNQRECTYKCSCGCIFITIG